MIVNDFLPTIVDAAVLDEVPPISPPAPIRSPTLRSSVSSRPSGSPGNLLRAQLAYKIDTSLVNPLKALPARVASDPPPSLAERNLLRGWRIRLPTGQDVARAMGVPVLADDDMLIGKFSGDPADLRGTIVTVAGSAFAGNCPLWTYVLAETVATDVVLGTSDGDQTIETRRLGPVGGRIVAETFVGVMLQDSSSWLTLDPRGRRRFP